MAALDLASGEIHYRSRERKRHREFLDLLKTLRPRWPTEKLYLIYDNFSPHHHPAVRAWAAAHQVELVFLPTYGSWLNWIESEFAALRYFALDGTDHRSHTEQNTAIRAYLRWRNDRAEPKTSFVTELPIRTWTHYPTNVARRATSAAHMRPPQRERRRVAVPRMVVLTTVRPGARCTMPGELPGRVGCLCSGGRERWPPHGDEPGLTGWRRCGERDRWWRRRVGRRRGSRRLPR